MATQGRMLLSHNFDISDSVIPPLSRDEFAQVFINGLGANAQCRSVNNPHWIVEVLFDTDNYSPAQMGELCAQALVNSRRSQAKDAKLPDTLILGGIKTTPPTSSSPDSLQPGQWGVDVVETSDAERFLQGIGWEATIATKSPDSIFKVQFKN
ncbi:hypothetical protein DSM106972_037520 [Dulcicalothrix desertica PCC 7102]|uniref:DUF2656 domain-containing protein n=1 Tax=Dulcicalothrix desertica PCC 7102 TaxID=232991 RepID=A0A3S5K397_9CYAN|nr:DUF2656 domain-containing protein [Dulcicalothrix desertica]RUT05745.1 hypothetical protein DSM106972_037520 [Dulcicalothrix desertica PCC 7102]TWH39589.1 uncharacterized protein DUF2656 [Dulcicalothrix desertica PCC 7102]